MKLRDIFKLMDRNGDGIVNRRELLLALRNPSLPLDGLLDLPAHVRQEGSTRARFERVFNDMDTDQSDEVSWGEFVQYLSRQQLVKESAASAGGTRASAGTSVRTVPT